MASDETEKLWRFLLYDEPMMNNYILCLSKLQRRSENWSEKCKLKDLPLFVTLIKEQSLSLPMISCLKLQFDLSKNGDKMKIENFIDSNQCLHAMYVYFRRCTCWGWCSATSSHHGGRADTWPRDWRTAHNRATSWRHSRPGCHERRWRHGRSEHFDWFSGGRGAADVMVSRTCQVEKIKLDLNKQLKCEIDPDLVNIILEKTTSIFF